MKRFERRRKLFKSFEAKSLSSRTLANQLADDMTALSGSSAFLMANGVWFVLWIIINVGLIPGVVPFDPFPFGLLTMAVSLEAIVLSILVLISQNRSAYIGTLRDEVHLQVNLEAEEEVTKILEILSEVRTKVGITRKDPELEQMLEHMDSGYIERRIMSQLEKANRPVWEQLIREFPELLNNVVKKTEIPVANGKSN